MSFLIQPTALRTKTATGEWKMMHRGADKHKARYLKRDKSQPLLSLTGAASLYLIKNICTSLTCTYSYFVPRSVSTVVTVQAPVEVTGVSLCAALPSLPGTRLAAVTAVRDQADAGRAPRWGLGALAGPPAVLGPCVGLCRGWDSAAHGEGGLASGLQTKKHSLESVTEKWGLQILCCLVLS